MAYGLRCANAKNLQPSTFNLQPSTNKPSTNKPSTNKPWPLATLREQLSKSHDTPNRLTLMHQIEGIINFF
ncbi:MAG: hypothetical protein F6K26_51335 [Moorea sp. SIO2I5]|nr:hypothetical protein [Moorena sp. SIO2I5]